MGILSKIGEFLGGGATSVASGAADIVERFEPGEVKQHEMALDATKVTEASISDARKLELRSHDTWFDVIVDGLNRLIRPFAFFSIFGAILGWWTLPDPDTIDPRYWEAGWIMIGFYFGQRAIMKDLPSALRSMRKALGK